MKIKIEKRPDFSSRRCVACWKCVDQCPAKAIRRVSILWHRHALHLRSACIACGKCVNVCPQGCFKAP